MVTLQKTIRQLVILLAVFLSSSLYASESVMVDGAGTLKRGKVALGLGFGFTTDDELSAGLALNFGVTKRYQVDIVSEDSTVGLGHLVNLFQSKDQAHYLSVFWGTGYRYFLDKALVLVPGVVYEYRLGEKKRVGIFSKFATKHFWTKISGSRTRTGASSTVWDHNFHFAAGVQSQLGKHFALSLEGVQITTLDFSENITGSFLAFSWAF